MSPLNRFESSLPEYAFSERQPWPHPLWSEWLLTNGLGGFSMGTVAGVPTRRYHGLLVAAMHPPVERVVALSSLVDRLQLFPADPARLHEVTLTSFHFRGGADRFIAPPVPTRFSKSVDCRWTYTVDPADGRPPATVEKIVHLFDHRNAVAVRYTVESHGRPWRLNLRPLVALRDFHALLRRDRMATRFQARPLPGGVMCLTREAGVHLVCGQADYQHEPQYWRSLEYIWEELRGLDAVEDLYSPGAFVRDEPRGERASVTLFASVDAMAAEGILEDLEARRDRLTTLAADTLARVGGERCPREDRDAVVRLALASDDFVVRRGPVSEGLKSIIAGYPWFSDWGRDTMISLPGLLLVTGRHEDALRTLRVFADHRRRGLIPNRFDDYSGPAHYNTVDAPLWFLHAAAEYLHASGDHEGYTKHLAPACLDIIDHFTAGTDHGIAVDPDDGLVCAGSEATQLTWMDAHRDGVTFTPRHGKPVEINALWHHGLRVTAAALRTSMPDRAASLLAAAERCGASFRRSFVNPMGGLFDRMARVGDEGGPARWVGVAETRPNQIFAVSLSHSPLSPAEQADVVRVVRERLHTPHGLRTLAPGERGYRGRLVGSMFDRDSAYHNGTVWPWLLGPFAEAVLRVGQFSPAARAEAKALLMPLVAELNDRFPGTIPEIYDGDHTDERPQQPDGCPAQAWSVAETLRVYALACRETPPVA